MLIEALDALILGREGAGAWAHASSEDLERWAPYRELHSRLKQVDHMSFFDDASGWLDAELRQERIAITERLNGLAPSSSGSR